MAGSSAQPIVLAESPARGSAAETITLREVSERVGSGRAGALEGRLQRLHEFLATAHEKARLGLAARRRLVDQAILLFEDHYAHLPLKRSMHAVDPVQKLRLLRMELDAAESRRGPRAHRLPPDRKFHRALTEIFTSVRDLHTLYLLPDPYRQCLAFLPFTVGEYFLENDLQGRHPQYMVTEVMDGFEHTTFQPGAELCYWNGVRMRRAVEIVADQHAGSNMAARRSHGVARLTLRPLSVAPAPDEEWVDITYFPPATREDPLLALESIRIWWLAYRRPPDDVFIESLAEAARESIAGELEAAVADRTPALRPGVFPALGGNLLEDELDFDPASVIRPGDLAGRAVADGEPGFEQGDGLDMEGEFVRRARNRLFPPFREPSEDYSRIETYDRSIVEAFRRDNIVLLKIHTFHVPDVDRFVQEITGLMDLEDLPRDGMILDVRGNAGGWIPAGERLLQLLTPKPIDPERFQFANSARNLRFCRHYGKWAAQQGRSDGSAFEDWIGSIERSVATGAIYSQGFVISDPELCNDTGQRYYGPVILVVDADCYSTTDIFIAGFRDHGIGPILGVHENTGAGGASTVTHGTLSKVLAGEDPDYRSLPARAEMQVALRRSVRVHKNQGTPIEDLGVLPELYQPLRKDDVLRGASLSVYEKAKEVLESRDENDEVRFPRYWLKVEINPETGRLRVEGTGFYRCTVFGAGPAPVTQKVSRTRLDAGRWDHEFDCLYEFELPSEEDNRAPELMLTVKGYYTRKQVEALNQRPLAAGGRTSTIIAETVDSQGRRRQTIPKAPVEAPPLVMRRVLALLKSEGAAAELKNPEQAGRRPSQGRPGPGDSILLEFPYQLPPEMG